MVKFCLVIALLWGSAISGRGGLGVMRRGGVRASARGLLWAAILGVSAIVGIAIPASWLVIWCLCLAVIFCRRQVRESVRRVLDRAHRPAVADDGWRPEDERIVKILSRGKSADSVLIAAGMDSRGHDASGEAYREVPRVDMVTPIGVGVEAVLSLAPGQTVDSLATKADSLAVELGALGVTVKASIPGCAAIVVRTRQPLEGVRESVDPGHGCGLEPLVVGRREDGRDLEIDLVRGSHLALQGMTGSGKSNTTYTLLGQLANRREVIVCGVDPSGLLLGPWGDGGSKAPIHLGSADMSHAAEMLERVVAEMDRRIAQLRQTGSDNVIEFTPELPLIVVVGEEWPGVIAAAKAEDKLRPKGATHAPAAARLALAHGRLTKESRKAGMRLVTLGQRFSASSFDTDDRANYGVRVTHRVDAREAVAMLRPEQAAELGERAIQFPPGMAIVDAPGEETQIGRFDVTDYATYRRRVIDGLAERRQK